MRGLRVVVPATIVAVIVLTFTAAVFAQGSGGQVWVRAFLDRDGDGARAAAEPLLTTGVTVDLVRDGVIIASASLDDAEFANQGLVGFQMLAAGEYTIVIAAGNYTATTPDRVIVQVSESGLPRVIEFGVQRQTAAVTSSAAVGPDAQTTRLLFAALGGVIAAGLTAAVGFVIYALLLRPRYVRAIKAQNVRRTTGTMRPVSDTGSVRAVSDTGSMRPVQPDDDEDSTRS